MFSFCTLLNQLFSRVERGSCVAFGITSADDALSFPHVRCCKYTYADLQGFSKDFEDWTGAILSHVATMYETISLSCASTVDGWWWWCSLLSQARAFGISTCK